MQPMTTTTIPIRISDESETIPPESQIPRLRWQEFISKFDSPTSLSDAYTRYRINRRLFSTNYCLLLLVCAVASVMGFFITILMFALVLYLWRNLHVFSDGSSVRNWMVVLGLVLLAVVLVWIFRAPPLNSSMLGTGFDVWMVVVVVHAVFRNPDGDYLDVDGAVLSGLIVPAAAGQTDRRLPL